MPERARERPQGQPLEADSQFTFLRRETQNTPSVAAKEWALDGSHEGGPLVNPSCLKVDLGSLSSSFRHPSSSYRPSALRGGPDFLKLS